MNTYSCGCNNTTSSTMSGCVTSTATLRGKIFSPEFVSAYSIAVQNGFEGTEQEWLDSLHGKDGKSAYELAIEDGFVGTLEEWIASLHGQDGKSAYQIAVEHGYTGTEDEWISEVSGNQEAISTIKEKIDSISQTLGRYGSKLDPIFEAEKLDSEQTGDSVVYKIVVAKGEPDDTKDVKVQEKIPASEINGICVL